MDNNINKVGKHQPRTKKACCKCVIKNDCWYPECTSTTNKAGISVRAVITDVVLGYRGI